MTYELSNLQQFESQVTSVNMSALTQEQKQEIYKAAQALDVQNRESISEYGTDVLKDIATMSSSILSRTKNNQLSEDVAHTLKSAIKSMKQASQSQLPEKKGLLGIFDRWRNRAVDTMFEIQLESSDVNQSLNIMEGKLQVYLEDLKRDAKVLENMKIANREHYSRLSTYIAASQLKLLEFENIILPKIKEEATASGDLMKINEYNELASRKTQLERHIHNLKSAQQSILQSDHHIVALQQADEDQKQQLQDHIMLSIPLWRKQLGLTSMMSVQAEISSVSKASSDFTNELMTQNAKLLHKTLSDVASQNERGIIDAESFKVVTDELESMITDVMTHQEEGARRRKEADIIFADNERRLRNVLLESSNKALSANVAKQSIIDAEFK